MLSTISACKEFLATETPAAIVAELRRDQERCRAGLLPSILALNLPPFSSEAGQAISEHLIDQSQSSEPPIALARSVKQHVYQGIISGIKVSFEQMGHERQREEEKPVARTIPVSPRKTARKSSLLVTGKFEAALEVLEYLGYEEGIHSLNEALTAIKSRISSEPMSPYRSTFFSPSDEIDDEQSQTGISSDPFESSDSDNNSSRSTSDVGMHINRLRPTQSRCYICMFQLREPHRFYPALCKPCGDFNIAESSLSLPENLNLKGKIALVTGGRVNLGFATALRMLRCGAYVMVSTRYPRDAEARFGAKSDSDIWGTRLKVIGADFRTARDAFRLVALVKKQVKDWSTSFGLPEGLDILINNAAQTLTDSIRTEKKAIQQEETLKQTTPSRFLIENDIGYAALVRGGLHDDLPKMLKGFSGPEHSQDITAVIEDPIAAISSSLDEVTLAEEPYSPSSWVQSMSEIPYEDIISAHSVNFFVPLILCRELLPLMGKPKLNTGSPTAPDTPSSTASSQAWVAPEGYIINVSSRDGIFENNPTAGMKNGKHVHTNTSKAALNMITETEARSCWQKYRVAMNTVDPGYMSAAPEMAGVGVCPIGWEDGAGRVLWPIAMGEKGGRERIWGRFLKHFGGVDIDIGKGRG
ncbi:hypothetical protein MMC18_003101 [Xylographa bjoerkii]|nr:hypothetical protein [Xylographa bjoerkii]